MLLDINAYVGHWPFQQLRYNTCEALLGKMNEYGVDVSVISNLNGIFYKNTQSANEELFNEIRSHRRFRDRFITFAVINPIYAGWRDDLEICLNRMGMKGIRLYPKYHDYDITDPSLIELVKRARDHGVPVAFKLRMFDSRCRSWLDIPYRPGKTSLNKEWTVRHIVPIVKEVPDAKYIILNVANDIMLNEEDTELFKKADLVFDTSGRQINRLPELIKIYGRNKFAFGTHFPVLDYLTGLLRIEALRENEADRETLEQLRWGNARRITGI